MSENKKVIYIVGMGPGSISGMSGDAVEALHKSDMIIGYTVYVDLVRQHFPDKEFKTTPMRQEIERCRICFDYAMEEKQVAMICSGDAGVYGMAAPMFEMAEGYPEVELVVIPGVTAANSGAAVLGAPLNHDYCVISLSDLLTPWEKIEARLVAAIQGDFAIAIYNPSSHKRKDYLKRACDIMLAAEADPMRACGYVENIGREGCQSHVCTLAELRECQVNMFTTVFVGNEKTRIDGDHLVTPRGYRL
ncbi:precorrin-3B C(17)-methyltransferase [Roseburia sp. NSJ-9]|uniref:Precorrin-3B C(17)-methyltransferase n=1 Tax=Roseburia lenta TaxID=2763061 RepID=A0ABR7GF13_9FIRM|nr:precorrin-3B C(17)-methyltransferase [Roseburia lenta]MBC5685416.1 precorrin-3B C(17)-methyltransferase [Roseburia lenta]